MWPACLVLFVCFGAVPSPTLEHVLLVRINFGLACLTLLPFVLPRGSALPTLSTGAAELTKDAMRALTLEGRQVDY